MCTSAARSAHNGASTYCGEVTDTYIDIGNILFQRWTEVDYTDGSYNQGQGPGEGGSGGPTFWGGTAYGIHTHCDTGDLCHRGFIYQVRYLHQALKNHNSDAKMLCDLDGNGTNMGTKCEPS